ncbi:arylesterase [Psychromonas sp. B3M02]|uniref:arylesterase n=1 Tax=Psychromonas sp. B3M02 TaxID=2267226 RepID=UPI000DEA7E8B|nr:arylesterase [Psychromonas sp. B3M02]RBW45044.1 arylesterase [Psychromonas sp. B3M02]
MKIYLCLLFITLLTACSDSVTLTPLNQQQPILAFGDSLTSGRGAEKQQSYPVQLGLLLDKQVINAGVNGETSQQGLKRLPKLLDQYQPQLLILCHGGNDILQNRNLDKMQDNLAQMIEMAQDRGIEVVLLSVPEASIFLPDIEQYQTLAKEYQIPLGNDIMRDVLKKPALHSDTVHPNAQGYRLIAQGVYDLLTEYGALD